MLRAQPLPFNTIQWSEMPIHYTLYNNLYLIGVLNDTIVQVVVFESSFRIQIHWPLSYLFQNISQMCVYNLVTVLIPTMSLLLVSLKNKMIKRRLSKNFWIQTMPATPLHCANITATYCVTHKEKNTEFFFLKKCLFYIY